MRKKVLLADDDADDISFFCEFFETHNDTMLLQSAENGLEVVNYLDGEDEDNNLPDHIILDQNMPKMNGRQTLEYLKSSPRYVHIPIIIYSTYTDKHLVNECFRLGASLVTTKPSTFEGYQEMMNTFMSVLSDKPTATASSQ